MTQGAVSQSFIWGNSLLEANGGNPADSFYYQKDHLGSPIRLLADDTGINEPLAYDEFGVPLVTSSANMHQPFGFTGYQTEDISGLYYAQARYYEPEDGRFTAEDIYKGNTSDSLSLNSYAYCKNNSIKYFDPDGNFPWLIIPAVIGVVALITGCSDNSTPVPAPTPVIHVPTSHEFKYTYQDYNDESIVNRTNCYAYAFDIIDNPVTGLDFKSRSEATINGT